MKLSLVLILLFSTINLIYCLKILVVYPVPSNSHYILGSGIVRPLVEAGHDVTFISPFKAKDKPKNGTWTDIVLEDALTVMRQGSQNNMFDREDISPYLKMFFINTVTSKMADYTLNHKDVQALLKSDAQFDVVIMENFVIHSLFGLAHYYNASLILVNSIHPRQWINWLVGNPAPPSYAPETFLSYSKEMTFFQRVNNVVFQLASELNNQLIAYPRQQKILEKHFPNAPPLEDLLYNVSLVFVNTNLATSQPIPKVPAMVDIGGYHMQPVKKLPKDLQQFLDNAKDGVIYFSMGSVLKSADMSQENKDAFLKVFSKLKQKVLWKWEEDNLPGQPPNVKTGKWLPQNDILAHPSVKLFITHGGFTSTTETIYHGVPVLAIPIFGDQRANAAQAVIDGYGLSLPYKSVNEENLTKMISELLNNPKYSENAKTRSKIFKDQITTPQERIRFWVEYVARHKGASHLRVEGLKLPWYKYLVLDVFAFLFSCVIIFIVLLGFIFKKLFCKNKNKSKLKTN